MADDYVWLERCRHLSEFNIFDTNSFAFTKGRPGALLIFSILYRIFGLNSTGFHVVVLFVHILNGFLIFIVLQRLRTTLGLAFLVALFFVVHFAQEESVYWIASLSSIFCLFFCLCAVLGYQQFDIYQLRQKAWVFLFSMLALSLREDALMLPFYLLLVRYLSGTNQLKGLPGLWEGLKENVLFFVPPLLYLFLRLSSAAIDPGPYTFTMNPLIWIKNAAYLILHLSLPIRYFFDQFGYEWHDRLRHLFSSSIWLAGMTGPVLFFLFWMIRKRKDVTIPNALKAGILLSGIGLLPYLSLDGNSPRFLYFSLVGGAFVLVHLIFLSTGWISKPAARRTVCGALSAGFVLICLTVLWERGNRWVASGLMARSLVEETKVLATKELSAGDKIYVANVPFTQNGAYIFNPGNFEAALSLTTPETAEIVEDIGNKSPDQLRAYEDRRVFIFQEGRLVEWRAR